MTDREPRLGGRVALITGASRGIGAAVARRFAREGAQLVLVARTVGGLEETDDAIRTVGGSATLVPLDLTDFEAIDRLGAAIYERFARLDVLVGNAAELGTLGPLGHIDPKTWDQVISLNLTANWRLVRSCDPLLRASDAGRVIFVTSGAATIPRAYWGAYAVSKAALEMMTRIYADEVKRTAIKVNMLDPGAVRTAMRAQGFPGEDPLSLRHPDDIADAFVDLAESGCRHHGEVVRLY